MSRRPWRARTHLASTQAFQAWMQLPMRLKWLRWSFTIFNYGSRGVVFAASAVAITWLAREVASPTDLLLWTLGSSATLASGIGVLKLTHEVSRFFFNAVPHVLHYYPMTKRCVEEGQRLLAQLNGLQPGLGEVLTPWESRWGARWASKVGQAQAREAILDHAWGAQAADASNTPSKSRL